MILRLDLLDQPTVLSMLTRIELEGGVARPQIGRDERRARLDAMLVRLPVLDFDSAAADAYRRIVESAGYSRRKLLDRMIAAQALVHGATLVTRNAADFRDVPGLDILDW